MDSSKRRFDESNTGAHEEPDKKKLAMSALERAKMIAAKISGAATASSSNPLSASTSNSSASYGAGSGSFYPAGGSFSRKVWIPQTPGINYVGLIIGPKAKTLRDLQARTNCLLQVRGRGLAKVSYDENGQVEEPHVFISGQTDESVELARKIIQEIMDNPDKAEEIKRSQNLGGDLSGSAQTGSLGSIYGMSTDTYGSITKIVHVPNELAGAVIGRGGDQIRQFQMQSQANIQIDNSPEAMTKSQRNITVQGTKEQVETAERIITEFVRRKQGGDSGATALDFPVQIKLEVPDNKVGLIIGKQGKTVGRIQQQFRCKVDIPVQHDEGNPLVRTLTVGAHTSEELESAKNDIVSVVTYGMPTQQPVYAAVPTSYPAAYPTMMSETKGLMIPDDLATAVTGHDGSIIQDIQLRTNCRVQIPQAADIGSNPATRTLSITGRSDQIVLAISEIKSIVERHGGQAYELSAASSGMAAYGGYGSQYPQYPGYGAQYAQGYGQGFAQYGAAYPQGNSYGQYVDTTNQGYSAPLPPSTEQSALSGVSTNTSGTEQNGNSSNNTEQLVQKYTKAQWLQWKEYYKSQGIEMADDAPEELRAEPYE